MSTRTTIKIIMTLFIGMSFWMCSSDDESQVEPAKFSIDIENHNFGKVEVAQTATQEFTITNKGVAELQLTAFTLEGANNDEFSTTAKSTTVATEKTFTFVVTFAPTTKGEKTATLKIATNVGERTIALNGNGTSNTPIIYVAGAEKNSNEVWVATLWENNQATALSDGTTEAKAFSVTVDNNNVYVVGYQKNSSGVKIATLWKNGVAKTLEHNATNSYDAEANLITVKNHKAYIVGYAKNSNGRKRATYWTINDSEQTANYLSDGTTNAELFSVFVNNNDVYLAGYKEVAYNGKTIATLWKNGTASALTDGTAYSMAHSIFVADGNVYVAGHEYSGNAIATVWKNGVATRLFQGNTQDGATAISVLVDNNDVYVTGMGNDSAMLWKNGAATNLTDGTQKAYASSVFVYNSDVYVTAYENNSQRVPVARMWKNGNSIFTNDKESFANSIFIKQK